MLDQALSGEPAAGDRCRVCGASLQGSLRCPSCRAVHGEGFRCPHCRAVADVEPDRGGVLRCRACGGPRLLVDEGRGRLSSGAVDALRRARQSRSQARLWKGGAFALGALGLCLLAVTAVTLLLFDPGVLVGALGVSLGCLPLLAALGAWRRSGRHQRDGQHELYQAELDAVRELTEAAASELTARELARSLSVDEARAELLLAELSLNDVVERRVTTAGELAYSAQPRVRVDEADEAEAEPTDTEKGPPVVRR